MTENISVNTDAALESAREIDAIVITIADDMEEIDKAINATIPDEIQTEWALSIKDNWIVYYNQSIQSAIEEMKQLATNIRSAIDAVLTYSNEQ